MTNNLNPDASLEELIAALAEGSDAIGKGFNIEAIQKLATMGTEAVGPLLAALKEGAPWARANAAMALGYIGDGREEVVQALSQAWLDPNKTVSSAGRIALMRLPHPTEPELHKEVRRRVDARLREIIQQRQSEQDRNG